MQMSEMSRIRDMGNTFRRAGGVSVVHNFDQRLFGVNSGCIGFSPILCTRLDMVCEQTDLWVKYGINWAKLLSPEFSAVTTNTTFLNLNILFRDVS